MCMHVRWLLSTISILLHIPVTATLIFIATAAAIAAVAAATAAEHQLSFAAIIKIKDELLKVNLNDWQLTVSLYTETKATRILLPCLTTHNYSPTPEQASCLKTNISKSDIMACMCYSWTNLHGK